MTKGKSSTTQGKSDKSKTKPKAAKTTSKTAAKKARPAKTTTKTTTAPKKVRSKAAVAENPGEPTAVRGRTEPPVSMTAPEDLHRMIAEAAYYRALARGFERDDALADWLAAEREIVGALSRREARAQTL